MENTWAIIPAYNEEKTIKEVILRTKKFIKNILIVNDGSTDKTLEIIENLEGIKILNVPKNSGKANALKMGMNYMKEVKAKKAITIDADLQHLPEEIPKFLEINADLILGVREKLNSEMPFIRKIGNYLASKIISNELGLKISDPQSGFRLYGEKAINELSFDGDKFNIEKTTLIEAKNKNLNISEIPITCIYNTKRKSYFTMKDALEFIKK